MTLVSNRYRVVRELGKGGFGTTSLVEDTQLPSGRRCVLKELRLIENSPEIYNLVKQRFEREAVVLEELGNLTVQIPSLYAYFAENNKFYLVQEYIEGETIAQRVQSQGVMSDAAVRELLTGLLPVLSLIHDRNIIHRDIKPENIILSQRDYKPVLIDFGAVRETMGTAINSQGNTTRSIVIGTPGFMASEQAAGRAVYGSDLYSLGLTAIYALTGKIPQELPTDGRTGDIQWRSFAPTVSGGLAAVIDRAISPHSRDRYSLAQEMLNGLSNSGFSGATIPGTTVSGAMRSNSMSNSMQPMSQMNTVVTAPDHSPQPISQNYSQPQYQQFPSNPQNTSKTWILALGVGALVALVGVGVMLLLKSKDEAQPIAQATPIATPTTVITTSATTPAVIPATTPAVTPAATPAVTPTVKTTTTTTTTPAVTPASVTTYSTPQTTMAPKPSVTTEQVSFDSGGSGAILRGGGATNQLRRYILNCGGGQTMTVAGLAGNPTVTILAPGGQTIGVASGSGGWRDRLPKDGNYVLEVVPSGEPFTISVEVN
jgi:serine/threonine-protein kinase